jgi:hypothetical protein
VNLFWIRGLIMKWIRGLGVGLLAVAIALPILAQEGPAGGPPETAGRDGPPDEPADRGGPPQEPAGRGGPEAARGGPDRGGPPGEIPGAGPLREIRSALGVGDDEWNVLLPKILAVQTAKKEVEQAARNGRGPARGAPARGAPDRGEADRGGPDRNSANPVTPTPLQEAQTTLQSVLAKSDASVDEYKAALAAVRAARRKSTETLAKAQNELIRLLTVRQEAVLLQLGVL